MLTVLASIFLPMSLVAVSNAVSIIRGVRTKYRSLIANQNFYGMNAVEINGGLWPLESYFITATVFTVLSILLPIVYLPLYQFLLRSAKFHPDFPEWVQLTVVGLTFVLNICRDILHFTTNFNSFAAWLNLALSIIICCPTGFMTGSIIRQFWRLRSDTEKRHSFIKENSSRLLFHSFTFVTWWIGAYVQPSLELSAYLLYAFIMFRRRWRKNIAKQDLAAKQTTAPAPV
jgi:hypothetical protein